MRFLIDQDIYQVTADFLRELGHDVIRAKLEALAKYCKQKEGINVGPGQIASALIHTGMARIDMH